MALDTESVRDAHKRIVREMMTKRLFELHHEMSEKLQKSKTPGEFYEILQAYEKKLGD